MSQCKTDADCNSGNSARQGCCARVELWNKQFAANMSRCIDKGMGGGRVMRDGADVKLGDAAYSASTKCLSASSDRWSFLFGSNALMIKATSGLVAGLTFLFSSV